LLTDGKVACWRSGRSEALHTGKTPRAKTTHCRRLGRNFRCGAAVCGTFPHHALDSVEQRTPARYRRSVYRSRCAVPGSCGRSQLPPKCDGAHLAVRRIRLGAAHGKAITGFALHDAPVGPPAGNGAGNITAIALWRLLGTSTGGGAAAVRVPGDRPKRASAHSGGLNRRRFSWMRMRKCSGDGTANQN
jgi:hypothetical protein